MNVVARRLFLESAQALAKTNHPTAEGIKTHLLQFEQIVRAATGENIAVRFVMPGERVLPIEPVRVLCAKPTCGVLAGEPEIVGTRCADGGKCHHSCVDVCWRKDNCGPLTLSGLTDDWKAPS